MSSWPAWEHLYTPVVSCSVRYPLPAWGAYPCRRQCLCTLSGWPPADWGLLAGLSARLPFGLPEEIQTARERTQAPLNASLPSVRYAPNTQGRGRKDPISVLPAGWRATAHSWPTLPSMGVGLPRGEARPLLTLFLALYGLRPAKARKARTPTKRDRRTVGRNITVWSNATRQ